MFQYLITLHDILIIPSILNNIFNNMTLYNTSKT